MALTVEIAAYYLVKNVLVPQAMSSFITTFDSFWNNPLHDKKSMDVQQIKTKVKEILPTEREWIRHLFTEMTPLRLKSGTLHELMLRLEMTIGKMENCLKRLDYALELHTQSWSTYFKAWLYMSSTISWNVEPRLVSLSEYAAEFRADYQSLIIWFPHCRVLNECLSANPSRQSSGSNTTETNDLASAATATSAATASAADAAKQCEGNENA